MAGSIERRELRGPRIWSWGRGRVKDEPELWKSQILRET